MQSLGAHDRSKTGAEFITSPAPGLKNLAARRQAMKRVKLSEEQFRRTDRATALIRVITYLTQRWWECDWA